MENFHEHKLWQDAYLALMDIHDVVDGFGEDEEMGEALVVAAQNVAAKVADGLSRADKRIGRNLIWDAIGLVAIARTQLAVCWGRKRIDDETFRNIDTKYADLSSRLQQYR
jgi:hypothetical protein